ncbi:MAG: MTH938/NDUFAF3 family protein [bacterium]|nr:MTH938/NDUFAF3 family protein [bacterium]
MIEAYRFGMMKVDGVRHGSDLILLPDGIRDGWRRQEGHRLRWEDLRESVEAARPRAVVVGSGLFGRMKTDAEVVRRLSEAGIAFHSYRTGRAVRTYNALVSAGEPVLAAFHLTC